MEEAYPDKLIEKFSYLIRVDSTTPDGKGLSILLRVAIKRKKAIFRDGLGSDTLKVDVRLLDADPNGLVSDWQGAVMVAIGEASAVSRNVQFSNGMVAVDPEWLRGIHIGTYVFNLLIAWAKENYSDYCVVPLKLLVHQAGTNKERDHRNRFYERFGFRFFYHDVEKRNGMSDPDLKVGDLSTVDSWERNISVVDETTYLRDLSRNFRISERDKVIAQKTAQNLSDGRKELYILAGKHWRRAVFISAAVAFVVGVWICNQYPAIGSIFG